MAQTAKAVLYSAEAGMQTEDILAPADGEYGDVVQLADGKAGVVVGTDTSSAAFEDGDKITVAKSGTFKMLKTTSMVLLDGGRAYWDRSAEKVNFETASGDYFLGRVVGDAASAATTCYVALNEKPQYRIELGKGAWTNAATEGEGVSLVAEGGSELKLSFDAVAEVAMAALYSDDTVPIADGPIFEGVIAIYDEGDNAALDINFGLANDTHATDFDSVTEAVVFHLDGNSFVCLAESDDGTTEVAATNTTVTLEDDTYAEFWIDCRNTADIQLYIDGVNVLPASTFKLDEATGPIKPIVHLEKTSDNTTADVRVKWLGVRSTDLTEDAF